MTQPAVCLSNIHKRFGGVHALRGASLCVAPGEAHALVGANGAGKSTLVKILGGVLEMDAGEIRLFGRPASIRHPLDAAALGIGMVPQEPLLCDNLSVAENIVLGREPVRFAGAFAKSAAEDEARALLERVGLDDVDPQTPTATLDMAQRQLVQVARALGCRARVLILDEPTSAITAHEAQRLFELVARLRGEGTTVIYVTHRLREVFQVCQRVTVMRDGVDVATFDVGRCTEAELVAAMAGEGREVVFRRRAPEARTAPRAEPPVLEVRGLTRRGAFYDVSFSVAAGEILGIAGLVGAGRSELARALCGIDPVDRGEIRLRGRIVKPRNAFEASALGLSLLPEDRKVQGLVPQLTMRENISVSVVHRLSRWLGLVDRRREAALAEGYRGRLSIHSYSVEQLVSELSGGNQQKVLLARTLAQEPAVLVLDEPTRGVDVAAKADIHALIRELARRGLAVLLISSELGEVALLAHRILVMREGRVVRELPGEEATEELLLAYAAGAGEAPAAQRESAPGG